MPCRIYTRKTCRQLGHALKFFVPRKPMIPPAIANGTVAAIAVPPVAKPTLIPTSAPHAPPAAVAANGVARLVGSELSNEWLHLGQVICATCLLLYWFGTCLERRKVGCPREAGPSVRPTSIRWRRRQPDRPVELASSHLRPIGRSPRPRPAYSDRKAPRLSDLRQIHKRERSPKLFVQICLSPPPLRAGNSSPLAPRPRSPTLAASPRAAESGS